MRLKKALATDSSAFVNASLYQLQAAARLPMSGTSEIAVNAALAMIEAAAPRNEVEAALAVQMACTHTAAMAVLARVGGGQGNERRMAAMGSAAARLLRAYTSQVEALRRLRAGGQQSIRVEHVTRSRGGTGHSRQRDPLQRGMRIGRVPPLMPRKPRSGVQLKAK